MKPQRKPRIYPLRNGCHPLRLLFQPYMRRAAARLRDGAEHRLYRPSFVPWPLRTLAILVTAFIHLPKNTTGGVAEAVSGCTLRYSADLRRTKNVYQYTIFVLSSIIQYNL